MPGHHGQRDIQHLADAGLVVNQQDSQVTASQFVHCQIRNVAAILHKARRPAPILAF
jgi:hypothetical protein